MITVTEPATQQLVAYFEGKEMQPIRVHLGGGGCAGVQLTLALDEVRDDDNTVELDAFTFVINKELSEAAGKVTIDLSQYGFTIKSENEVGGGGGCGCASSGTCGSAGSGGCNC
ncbi:IscA/HesB family protein [Pseudodesulfovibrio sediminis]|uniref:Core domain-containing protein n=1 Tax=Pseudodesulfovibrio sediminis TaxID=2810563 RepID=A0ABM7P9A0_9BACT|nr:IscA/HesB family protein [Pseudodesulfovibrio sediminis]BCS89646.1 hypothetical protein PSDVSF_28880 [Pseudodesulfovibrio sediminis]